MLLGFTLLLLGVVSTCHSADVELAVAEVESERDLSKREVQTHQQYTQQQYQQQYDPNTAAAQTSPEYLAFLQQLQGDAGSVARGQQVAAPRGTPQAAPAAARYSSAHAVSSQQFYQPTGSSNAFQLHQARLRASLAGEDPSQAYQSQQQQHQQSAERTAVDERRALQAQAALQQQASADAQQAALAFQQAYQQQQQQQQPQQVQQVYQPARVKTLRPTYATESPVQTYQQEEAAAAAPEYQPARPQLRAQAYQPPAQASYQPNLAAQIYQQSNTPTAQPISQGSLRAYQAQASLAEQAAIAFQEALQQQSRTPGQQRPRIALPQYNLENQFSYVVPTPQSQPKGRRVTAPTPTQEYSTGRRPTAQAPVPTTEYNLAAIQQAYSQIEQAQEKQLAQIHQRPAPTSPTYDDESALIDTNDGFESIRQPTQSTRQHVPATVQIPSKARVPQYVQYAPAPTPSAPAPTQYTSAQYTPAQYTSAITLKATPATTQYTPTVRVETTAPTQYTSPVRASPVPTQYASKPAPSQYETAANIKSIPNLGNIDLQLLSSLYAAAESLARSQGGNIGPVTEDDLLKALLSQGRREKDAANILMRAAKAPLVPEPKEEVEVVRIPSPKNQRPLSQGELQALIAAGYDVRPVDESPAPAAAQARQRSQRGNPTLRRSRGEKSSRISQSEAQDQES